MTDLYKNATLRTISFEGNTESDLAIRKWNMMTPLERCEILGKVYPYKSIAKRERACVNYVADYLL